MRKVLVVDDDRTIRTVMNGIVKKSGCSPINASNGLRALHILQDNNDIAAIITDLAMPEKDGKALIEEIRLLDKYKTTPVLVVSGVASHSELISLLQIGATECLPKPISPDKVGDFLDEYVNV